MHLFLSDTNIGEIIITENMYEKDIQPIENDQINYSQSEDDNYFFQNPVDNRR